MPEDPKFHGVLLPEEPTIDQVREIVPDYTEMLLRVMTALADRADRHPDYPFVDTKLDLITGGDFPEEDPIRGREPIYGWIQGRALEALAGHCIWIHRQGLGTGLLARLQALMRRTLFQLRQMRRSNNGRLSFFMTPEGAPFKLGADGQKEFFKLDPNICGTSDLFCAKGMLAAARVLGDLEATDEARAYCHQVDDAIWQDRYASDQQPLDPKNPVTPVPGRHPHGQFMIQIGTAAMMAAMEANRDSIPLGLRLIRHELRHHANLENRLSELEEFDFWEAIDDEGQPYRDGDTIVCDPGHALEFVGLALKFTSLVKHLGLASDQQLIEIDTIETALPPLLLHIFDLGFLPGPGGIIKAYDLEQRQPLNTDMPWWNLPETMRAAILCWRISKNPACLRVLSACHNAFVRHFLRPDLHLMAVQPRNEWGEVIPVIPATADADPGYHTGLSIIDVLDVLKL